MPFRLRPSYRPVDTDRGAPFRLDRVDNVTKVAQLTGHDSINHTGAVEVAGQDPMRVAEADVERQGAYEYFTGVRDGGPAWAEDPAAATQIVDGTVGELSVMWSSYLERWIMTATDGSGMGSTIREGISPWGPWGDPKPLVTQADLVKKA